MVPDRLQGLPPIIGAQARVLILGSFPSAASLAAQQYYAHPQNQFWRILGAVLEQTLKEMDYPARLVAVQAAGIAIWDVFASCLREGSMDSAIRDALPNDLAGLKKSAPALRRVCFNGKKAGDFAWQFSPYFETLTLPSTSALNARMRFEAKLLLWREGLCGGT